MRRPSRSVTDLADPLIRRALRGWTSSAQPPVAARKHLLTAAGDLDAVASSSPPGNPATRAFRSLWAAAQAARPNLVPEVAWLPFEYQMAQSRVGRRTYRTSRQESWYMFSFGVMMLTFIR